jgi:hypothetical protein
MVSEEFEIARPPLRQPPVQFTLRFLLLLMLAVAFGLTEGRSIWTLSVVAGVVGYWLGSKKGYLPTESAAKRILQATMCALVVLCLCQALVADPVVRGSWATRVVAAALVFTCAAIFLLGFILHRRNLRSIPPRH